MRMNMCAMYIGYYRMRCAWQCDTGSADCACIVWGWLVPQYVLQAVQDTVRLQCMRMMHAWQCLGHYLCADCACSAVYEDDACMRRWLANRWNWRRRSGRGYLCPPGHALSYNPHLPQPAAGAKCILYFLVCISFLMQTIQSKTIVFQIQVFICKPIPSKPIQCSEKERNRP